MVEADRLVVAQPSEVVAQRGGEQVPRGGYRPTGPPAVDTTVPLVRAMCMGMDMHAGMRDTPPTPSLAEEWARLQCVPVMT